MTIEVRWLFGNFEVLTSSMLVFEIERLVNSDVHLFNQEAISRHSISLLDTDDVPYN
jgi:hypothetical protein